MKVSDYNLIRDAVLKAAEPKGYDRLKRVMDLVIAIFMVTFFSPLWGLIAVLIKLTSRGPVLYSGVVVGKREIPFNYYKFRTMYHESDDREHRKFIYSYVNSKPMPGCTAGKYINDDRITSLGRILRRTSLDEFPQLINVIRGEMSLIGPRPPVLYEYHLYHDRHKLRLAILPGITGLNQVEARADAGFEEMIDRDLLYILNRSFVLDLRILLKTVMVVITGRGAY